MRTFAGVMSVLFVLVMVYVWQHFSAIEIGYHVEAQKQQVEQLREENRQLRLSEAQLTDPGRIDRIAKQLGLSEPEPGQVVRPEGGDPNAPALAQATAPGMQLAQ
jgi:cell division protein FtsL